MIFLRVSLVFACVAIVFLHLGESSVLIHFDRAPPALTRFSTAVFFYNILDPNGNKLCADDNGCSIFCELDGEPLRPCPVGLIRFRSLAGNHEHSFRVNVTTPQRESNSSTYKWFIDTIPPTATLVPDRNFTNARSVMLDISFSEPCPGKGGFKCSAASNCNVVVDGPATVDASVLQEIEPYIKYRLALVFSQNYLFGRVVVRLADRFCTDHAENAFTRTNSSITIIHFDRRPVNVDMWTSVPSYELEISHIPRTILATNKVKDLKIFLDFSDPIVNSTNDILAALEVSEGQLTPIHGGSHGNRRFGFEVRIVSETQIVTVKLESSSLIGRSGAHVSPVEPVVFLFDSTKPSVRLSSGTLEVTKDPRISVVVEFAKPVFGFDSSSIAIEGGRLARFKELSKALYSLTILSGTENVVTVFVPEGRANDIAGNLNLASNQLEVRHYSVPAISVALHSFITVGLLATSLAAGVLALSTASLAALGDLNSSPVNIALSDPSRNLLGMAGHMQVFVFSNWLSTSLPVEYSETTKGLSWIIPREKLPWNNASPLWPDYPSAYEKSSTILNMPRGFSSIEFNSSCTSPIFKAKKTFQEYPSCQNPCRAEFGELHRRHNVSVKDVPYGLPLESFEYFVYFLRGEPLSAASVVKKLEHYTGWIDFKMNAFWVAVAGGGLTAIHILVVVFLRCRTRTNMHGVLLIPRFELFLLILVLPCICQASGFLLRGGTTGGIIIGALLLSIPAAFFISVTLFLIVAIFSGGFVQYKELKQADQDISWHMKLMVFLIGRSVKGKWFQWDGTPVSFMPRYGILFEDRRGPRLFVKNDHIDPSQVPEWTDSGQNGIGRMRAVSSDDGNTDVTISTQERLLGCSRSAYILVDLLRRVGIGIITGAYPSRESSNGHSRLILALAFTLVQFLYLALLKPYIRKGVQLVEIVSLLCETGVFGLALYLDCLDPDKSRRSFGIIMLSLVFTSFAGQLVNEWYALIKCLLQLPLPQNPSLRLGLKWVLKGIILPFLPKRYWARLIPSSSQPKTGLVPVVSPHLEADLETRNIGRSAMTATVVPVYSPEPPTSTHPRRTMAASPETGGETNTGPFLGSCSTNQRNRMRMVEEKRPKISKLEPRDEMKKLQKLAMASFGRNKKGGEGSSSSCAGKEQICSDESSGKE
ncbi:hypothetical protein H6P81_012123 [Aristolochia fimbriata]|uniref:Bacterial Ig-like domain-containing protein n=1 Tax=Aristolochia fimbriata TaxID=158543 RepID=A0AAV7EAX3_ARIFI|nr:hypothetical protein H6P81_012123 [Aristolochia fimbriata]